MKLLVLNADDFGLDPAINAAVARAHIEGLLTSASLTVGATHVAEAIEFAHQHPGLGVGIHLCLVDELPKDSPWRVAPLASSNGKPHDIRLTNFRELSARHQLADAVPRDGGQS